MFEIRVICNPGDTDRITAALADTFTTGTVRCLPSRHDDRARLYVAADHKSATTADTPESFRQDPETAYALAPSITSEISWTAYHSVGRPTGALLGREFWLRKAALLDRVALAEDEDQSADAVELATEAARRLIEFDRAGEEQYAGVPHGPDHPDTKAKPRGYVRQEYAAWQRHQ
ncbi:hypothetical protein HRW23_20245 [Streptomyces lunaelactis]|uniref:hypothetical protein n=1 Tax=Streptomyces lunaelactis TaxID=1535768 RepID=UPI001584DF45|nr:hypothetical protein [Streptomyces lunaelactis]NUK71103.1 hypothetical protein [Streptomyces lunaelactis]NUK79685.1 hypothetical protein [Streptomyces lunaelactis]